MRYYRQVLNCRPQDLAALMENYEGTPWRIVTVVAPQDTYMVWVVMERAEEIG